MPIFGPELQRSMTTAAAIKLFICDDHRIVIEGLQRLLEDMDQVECVGTATGGEEALAQLEHLPVDIVILDLNMPGMDGGETMRRIKDRWPDMRVIILTMDDGAAVIRQLVRDGADGYLLKTCGRDEFLLAVQRVWAGHRHISEEAAEAMLHHGGQAPGGVDRLDRLSTREREVLKALADGLSNKEIGERLFISHRTVDTHRTNLMKKLGVHNLAELVRIAIAAGLVR